MELHERPNSGGRPSANHPDRHPPRRATTPSSSRWPAAGCPGICRRRHPLGHRRRHRVRSIMIFFALTLLAIPFLMLVGGAAAWCGSPQAARAANMTSARQHRRHRQAVGRRQDHDRGRPALMGVDNVIGDRRRRAGRGHATDAAGDLRPAGQRADRRLRQPAGDQADGPLPGHHHIGAAAAGLDRRQPDDRRPSRGCPTSSAPTDPGAEAAADATRCATLPARLARCWCWRSASGSPCGPKPRDAASRRKRRADALIPTAQEGALMEKIILYVDDAAHAREHCSPRPARRTQSARGAAALGAGGLRAAHDAPHQQMGEPQRARELARQVVRQGAGATAAAAARKAAARSRRCWPRARWPS